MPFRSDKQRRGFFANVNRSKIPIPIQNVTDSKITQLIRKKLNIKVGTVKVGKRVSVQQVVRNKRKPEFVIVSNKSGQPVRFKLSQEQAKHKFNEFETPIQEKRGKRFAIQKIKNRKIDDYSIINKKGKEVKSGLNAFEAKRSFNILEKK